MGSKPNPRVRRVGTIATIAVRTKPGARMGSLDLESWEEGPPGIPGRRFDTELASRQLLRRHSL